MWVVFRSQGLKDLTPSALVLSIVEMKASCKLRVSQ